MRKQWIPGRLSPHTRPGNEATSISDIMNVTISMCGTAIPKFLQIALTNWISKIVHKVLFVEGHYCRRIPRRRRVKHCEVHADDNVRGIYFGKADLLQLIYSQWWVDGHSTKKRKSTFIQPNMEKICN